MERGANEFLCVSWGGGFCVHQPGEAVRESFAVLPFPEVCGGVTPPAAPSRGANKHPAGTQHLLLLQEERGADLVPQPHASAQPGAFPSRQQCTESIPLKTGLWLSAAGTRWHRRYFCVLLPCGRPTASPVRGCGRAGSALCSSLGRAAVNLPAGTVAGHGK